MFGLGQINSFEQVGQIAEGWAKDIVKAEQELHDTRMEICKKCPLYSESSLGPKCDAKKCFNTKRNEVTLYPGSDITCGCGCFLDKKTRVKDSKCVLNKW